MVHQDATHELRGNSVEVQSVLPVNVPLID
jgi:hypothetical protein